jgi:hypothetical protein
MLFATFELDNRERDALEQVEDLKVPVTESLRTASKGNKDSWLLRRKAVFRVPERALVELQGSYQIGVLGQDNKAEIRPIKTIHSSKLHLCRSRSRCQSKSPVRPPHNDLHNPWSTFTRESSHVHGHLRGQCGWQRG